jgi:hypothetical protein
MKTIVLCCAAALVFGVQAVGPPQSAPLIAADWGGTNAGLRMAIAPLKSAAEPSQQEFYVALENVGDSDVVVNMGSMLATGKVMFPEAVGLVLADSQGATRELQYFDRQYAVAGGRVDDFIVALRAGSLYTIRVSLDRYRSPATKEYGLKLGPGRYRIEARFEGHGARFLNSDTPGIALLNFWKGMLRSNSLSFEIR